jgi:hypothetical protein
MLKSIYVYIYIYKILEREKIKWKLECISSLKFVWYRGNLENFLLKFQ